MVNLSVVGAAALIGLVGGAHCVAMCGPTSMAIARTPRAAIGFHAGRLTGYAMLGALASAGAVGMARAASAAAWMHPVWLMGHVLLAVLGAWMLWTGRHPRVVQEGLLRAARGLMRVGVGPGWAPAGASARIPVNAIGAGAARDDARKAVWFGLAWALWPCGLLYSAVAIAWLTQEIGTGAAAMFAFAATSGLQLWLGQRGMMVLLRAGREATGIRIAGAVTLAVALALVAWTALGHSPADFCLPGV